MGEQEEEEWAGLHFVCPIRRYTQREETLDNYLSWQVIVCYLWTPTHIPYPARWTTGPPSWHHYGSIGSGGGPLGYLFGYYYYYTHFSPCLAMTTHVLIFGGWCCCCCRWPTRQSSVTSSAYTQVRVVGGWLAGWPSVCYESLNKSTSPVRHCILHLEQLEFMWDHQFQSVFHFKQSTRSSGWARHTFMAPTTLSLFVLIYCQWAAVTWRTN